MELYIFNNADPNDDNAEQEFYSLLPELAIELSDLDREAEREEHSPDPFLAYYNCNQMMSIQLKVGSS